MYNEYQIYTLTIQQTMKTVHSFFPTTTKSKASFRKQLTYKVMKKVQSDSQLEFHPLQPKSHFAQPFQSTNSKPENIFRDKKNSVKNYSIDQTNDRPIGGIDLFKRMEKANHLGFEESTRRISKKGSRKNINVSRQRNCSNQSRSHLHVNISDKDQSNLQQKEETFKEHTDCKQRYTTHANEIMKPVKTLGNYMSQPTTLINGQRKFSASEIKRPSSSRKYSQEMRKFTRALGPQSAKSSSVQSLSQVTDKDKLQVKWATQQQKNYLDKMAILNEINYNKPLIQKLGNKYFECMLRNRYMDEPEYNHKSPYIYQIKDKMADTKFISKIKNMKCNFLERSKIVVKGRSKVNKEHEEKIEHRQGKKRWEEWNQDSFEE